jgi:hypothetical protein
VDTTCWSQTAGVSSWLQRHGLSEADTYMQFVRTAAKIALRNERQPVQWIEVFEVRRSIGLLGVGSSS